MEGMVGSVRRGKEELALSEVCFNLRQGLKIAGVNTSLLFGLLGPPHPGFVLGSPGET